MSLAKGMDGGGVRFGGGHFFPREGARISGAGLATGVERHGAGVGFAEEGGTLKKEREERRQMKHWICWSVCVLLGVGRFPTELSGAPLESGPRKVGLKLREEAAVATMSPRVVAYCVFPGVPDRFVITSEQQLLKVTQAGEISQVGVLTAPISKLYLCMIRTDQALIGITSQGQLVNPENGVVLGAVVPSE
jgi:hypothetical protein